jgi:hypothetical protein
MTSKHLQPGELWTADHRRQFRILALEDRVGDAWIRYENCLTLQVHDCRVEAFISRFTWCGNQ